MQMKNITTRNLHRDYEVKTRHMTNEASIYLLQKHFRWHKAIRCKNERVSIF